MACQTCRSQTRSMLRSALRAGAAAPSPVARNLATPAATTRHSTTTRTTTVRSFSSSSPRQILGLRDSYRVVGASERLFKVCAKPADYRITDEERKQDLVQKRDDGEEIGKAKDPENVWHKTFGLQPSFSTWSHVTMLHLYLINARLRCFDRDEYRNWSQQMIDHFFFECEKKMHLDHNITSSALRQRYLKDIFVQWRGLLLAYDEGLVKGDAILASAVWRNLFKGDPEADPRALVAVVGWVRASLAALEAASDATFAQQAAEVLERPVDVFWTRLEVPFLSDQQQQQQQQQQGDGQKQTPEQAKAKQAAAEKVAAAP
ncbi:Ubiquinol-cytochrome C chaperone [Cordyceps fumosorosea ARSEF 2679]|uniref:Ubiquinol-cytochrome C chaperone n=1 Tax=Cordyceps fumosorosea (strain ARSEF 2679) TaxID=1081104 RepID=A0A162JUC0_CORFA|nr:Ubiquinol-cytochrome C chaperone [Cordyceps fumosorosea ARSEF 2679]OAA73912.1 Ubiquinol-cytochrome C chaperone [Cordyceps fumosorosea ARSEF 2679]